MLQEHFLVKLVLILAGYSSVLLPFYCLIRYVEHHFKESDHNFWRNTWWRKFLRSFAIGHPECRFIEHALSNDASSFALKSSLLGDSAGGASMQMQQKPHAITMTQNQNFFSDCFRIFVYFFGIQITLVSMGFFQERIITQGYLRISNPLIVEKFDDAQFLVFINRLFGMALSGAYLIYDWKKQPIHIPPLYVHSFTSMSNTISSWCQYEALKYVSFPTQTVCKASKVIPTMLMGRLLRKERYPTAQYVLAILLVSGASIFFLAMNSKETHHHAHRGKHGTVEETDHSTTISGLILMAGYLALDAFTPNYQKKLMESRVSCCQMMFYVNAFSAFLCLVSLLQQLTFFSSFSFILTHYDMLRDCCLLSLGSACGQIFIYQTIEEFGPVVLSVMMTLRQIFSIILSAIYFSHPISVIGAYGLTLVFGAIFADIYRKYNTKNVVKN